MTNEELIQKYYDGNKQALSELYEQNIGYLKSTAMAVLKKSGCCHFSAGKLSDYSQDMLGELIQAGSLVFTEGVTQKKYCSEKGSFLTYITPYLRSAMRRHIEKFYGSISVSHNDAVRISQCRRLHAQGLADSEIAGQLSVSEKLVAQYLQFSYTAEPLMIDAEDEYGTEEIQNPRICVNDQHPNHQVYHKLCLELFEELFQQLSAKDRQILGNHFGAYGYEHRTLEEIADFELLTKDAVLKSKNNAIKKLHKLYHGSKLETWQSAYWTLEDVSMGRKIQNPDNEEQPNKGGQP